MVNIPSDIKTPEDAKHWLRVNGHSAEKAEAITAELSASTTPVVSTPVASVSMPAPSPVVNEDDDDSDEDEDWDDDEIDEEE